MTRTCRPEFEFNGKTFRPRAKYLLRTFGFAALTSESNGSKCFEKARSRKKSEFYSCFEEKFFKTEISVGKFRPSEFSPPGGKHFIFKLTLIHPAINQFLEIRGRIEESMPFYSAEAVNDNSWFFCTPMPLDRIIQRTKPLIKQSACLCFLILESANLQEFSSFQIGKCDAHHFSDSHSFDIESPFTTDRENCEIDAFGNCLRNCQEKVQSHPEFQTKLPLLLSTYFSTKRTEQIKKQFFWTAT